MPIYKIQDHKYRHESFTILRTENIDHLQNIQKLLIKNGKEPILYILQRVVSGTRKKPYSLQCWRFANSNNFILN